MINQITSEFIRQYLISHVTSREKAERTLHVHPNAYEVMLFKSGNVDYFINDITFHLKPGDLTLVKPGDIHGYFVRDNSIYERMPVHIEESLAISLSTEETNLLACFSTPTTSLYHFSRLQMQQFEYYVDSSLQLLQERAFGYDVALRANLSMLLLLANQAHLSSDAAIKTVFPQLTQDAITYVNNNLANNISVQSIADDLNISRSRLCHVFKDSMGVSLWNYVVAQRIQHAQDLLRQGATITTACYESGFQNYSHFEKVFHKITGMSPGKYAKNRLLYQNMDPKGN